MRDDIISRGGEAQKSMNSTIMDKLRIPNRGWKQLMSPKTVFEIAVVTHLYVDQAVDNTAILQRQEMQLEKLKKFLAAIVELKAHIYKEYSNMNQSDPVHFWAKQKLSLNANNTDAEGKHFL